MCIRKVFAKQGHRVVAVFARHCDREKNGKNMSDVIIYLKCTGVSRVTVFLNVLDSWVRFLRLITYWKSLQVCSPMAT